LLFYSAVRFDVEEWIMAFMNNRNKGGNRKSGNATSRLEKPMVYFVSAKQERRIERMRAAFQPEVKPKITLPKFSWDKTND